GTRRPRTGAVRPAGPQAEGDRGEGEGRGAPAAVGAEEGSGSGRQGSGMRDQVAGISDRKPVGTLILLPLPTACCLLPPPRRGSSGRSGGPSAPRGRGSPAGS